MSEYVEVDVGGTQFLLAVEDSGGVGTVGLDDVFSLDGVKAAIEAVAEQMGEIWIRAKPQEASVEFNVKVVVKAGKLTGLIADGGGESGLTVKLTWRSPTEA